MLQANSRAPRSRPFVSRCAGPMRPPASYADAHVDSASQAFVPYGGPRLAADAAFRWTVQVRGADARWGPVSAPAHFTTGLRRGDWTAAEWLRPAGDSQQPDRVTYVRTEVAPPTAPWRAPPPMSLPLTPTASTWTGRPSTRGRFLLPGRAVRARRDLTGTLAGGRRSAIGSCTAVWPRAGRPASSRGFSSSSRCATRRPPSHLGSDATWRERPAEWLPSPQRNAGRRRLRRMGRRSLQPQGWSSPGYTTPPGRPVTVIGPAGTAPFTNTYPSGPPSVRRRCTPFDCTRWGVAGSWRTSGRLRGAAPGLLRQGSRGAR